MPQSVFASDVAMPATKGYHNAYRNYYPEKNDNLVFEVDSTAVEPLMAVIASGLQADQTISVEVSEGDARAYATMPAANGIDFLVRTLVHAVKLRQKRDARKG